MLTGSQLQTLKNDIAADPTLSTLPMTSDGSFEIAAAYNLLASPDFWVWRTAVSKDDFINEIGPDGTTFTWVGNGFITRTVGEQNAWDQIFGRLGTVNPSKANVRQAFADIFSGTGNAAANRTHLLAMGRRKATRGEKLFATGTGSTASPATITVEGNLSYQDVEQARNLP